MDTAAAGDIHTTVDRGRESGIAADLALPQGDQQSFNRLHGNCDGVTKLRMAISVGLRRYFDPRAQTELPKRNARKFRGLLH